METQSEVWNLTRDLHSKNPSYCTEIEILHSVHVRKASPILILRSLINSSKQIFKALTQMRKIRKKKRKNKETRKTLTNQDIKTWRTKKVTCFVNEKT